MKLSKENAVPFINKSIESKLQSQAIQNNQSLHEKTGAGNEFLGWLDLPEADFALIEDIEKRAEALKDKIDMMVVIGIGGSYLGAKAVIEALSSNFSAFDKEREYPTILFAGHNIGEDYLYELRKLLQKHDYALTIISKSGTTTEPAVAFRFLKNDLESKYGKEEAARRITAITDKEKGALKTLADEEGYKTYIIPDDVGGRFSVLTPVGLWPIAIAGFNIRKLLEGAKNMMLQTAENTEFESNLAAQYAALRNNLYQQGFTTEILVNYEPRLAYFAEWWKQLYGESEGKDGKGIFPASVNFTTDLHSLGQYIQDGRRMLFETLISVQKPQNELRLPEDKANLDNLNYLSGKRVDEINKNAELGTVLAHVDGGVPNIRIEIPELNEYYLGELIFFFEKACGISGYILGVNPFDQPGVEAYKRNMFALLEKPGFEGEREKLLG